ncbi:MAG: hypothetical protein HZC29_04300 [Thaumarchaeota archaeon]|nr:hypothetical protein [Nitrososphaerota archaeon]
MNQSSQTSIPKIDYRILGLIGIVVALYFLGAGVIQNIPVIETFTLLDVLYDAVYVINAAIAFMVAKRYLQINNLGKAYLALGSSFLLVAIGDVIWNITVLMENQEPFPSLADVFYFASYPLIMYHVLTHVRVFKHNISHISKIFLVGIPIVMTGSYVITSQMESGTDLYVGAAYVAITSLTMSFAILGMQIFKKTILKSVWLLLLIGIFIVTIGDIWYSYTIEEAYDPLDPVYVPFVAGQLVIIYALYLHKKTF